MTSREHSDGRARTAQATPSPENPAAGDSLDVALTQALALACAPIAPDADTSARIKARLLDQIRSDRPDRMHSADALPGTITIRADAGEWTTIAPKVHVKQLHRDAESRSFLLRIDAGGTLVEHYHDSIEEFVVLEGECHLGSLRLAAGDYHLAGSGSTHVDAYTPSGLLLFIRTGARHGYAARS